MMAIPMKQVITPPILKLIRRGHRFEKSFAGETTFAPMFTFNVASRMAIKDTTTATGEWKRLKSCTGSQIADSKMTTVAEVTATPMNAYKVIVVGKASAWPMA